MYTREDDKFELEGPKNNGRFEPYHAQIQSRWSVPSVLSSESILYVVHHSDTSTVSPLGLSSTGTDQDNVAAQN